MKEITRDIWEYYEKGHWIVITTNGTVKANGEAVMGRGIALQAKQRFPAIAFDIGHRLRLTRNNCVFCLADYRVIVFPVKHNWYEQADMSLIEKSTKELAEELALLHLKELYLVRPGCGNGQLEWKDVKPILEKYLDDRFVIVQRKVL